MKRLWNVVSESLKMIEKSLTDIPKGEQRDRILKEGQLGHRGCGVTCCCSISCGWVSAGKGFGQGWDERQGAILDQQASIPKRPVSTCGGMCTGGQHKPPSLKNTTVCVMFYVCLGLLGLVVCTVCSWSQGFSYTQLCDQTGFSS